MPSNKQEKKKLNLAAITGAGALGGGYAGLRSLHLIPKETRRKIIQNIIANKPIIIGGILAPELAGGSGEAMMALKLARKLKEKGYNVRFGITGGGEYQVYTPNKPYDIPGFRDPLVNRGDPLAGITYPFWKGSAIDHNNLLKLNKLSLPNNGGQMGDALLTRILELSGKDGKNWLLNTSPEEQKKIFSELLSGKRSKLGIDKFDDALKEIRLGKWDDWAPGRLMTLLKLDNSLKPILEDGRDFVLLPGEVKKRLETGRAAGVLSTERGFNWASPAYWTSNNLITPSNAAEAALLHGLPEGKIRDKVVKMLAASSSGLSSEAVEQLATLLKTNNIDLSGAAMGRGFTGLDPMSSASAEQLLSDHIGPNKGVKNLGLAYNFKANPLVGEPFIPGIDVATPPETLDQLKKMKEVGRNAMFQEINRIRGINGLADLPASPTQKVLFLSGGSIGPNGTQKLLDALRATSPDVHIFNQIGGSQEFLDMVQNNSAYQKRIKGMTAKDIAEYRDQVRKSSSGMSKDLERVYQKLPKNLRDRITLTSRMDRSLLDKVTYGADAYGFYGGSSTAAEAAAVPNRLIATTDDMLNIGNIDNALTTLQSTGTAATKLNNTSTAILRHLKQNRPLHRQLMRDAAAGKDALIPQSFLDDLTKKYRIGISDFYKTNKPLTYKQLLQDVERARTDNEKAFQNLFDIQETDDFLEQTLNRAKRVAEGQNKATKTLENLVKNTLDDPKLIDRIDDGLRFSFSPAGIKNGLKGSYLRLGKALTKNRALARFAPLALGVGAIGGGAGAFALGKKLQKD